MLKIKRSDENPILIPNSDNPWEAEATFNACPILDRGKIHLVYRAMSSEQMNGGLNMQVSSIGYASSKDGIHFKNRRQFIKPENDWERFGCEDPRVTKLNGKYYIFILPCLNTLFGQKGLKSDWPQPKISKKSLE